MKATEGRGLFDLPGLSLAFLCFLWPSMIFGQAGEAGRLLTSEGADARGMALGRACTAVANDNTSLYWNPAGLGHVLAPQASALHVQLFEQASYDHVGYAHPSWKGQGSWGAQVLRLAAGRAEKRDSFNDLKGDFGYQETALGLGAGYRGLFSPRLSVGSGFNVLQRRLAGSSDTLYGLDAGAQYRVNNKARLGMNVQNALSGKRGDTSDRLPRKIRLGAAYNVLGDFLLAMDLENFKNLSLGTEYGLRFITLRAGIFEKGLTMGGGLSFRGMRLDYAVQSHAELGLSQRFSIAYKFGPAKDDASRKRALRLFEESVRLRRQGRWSAALGKMNQADSLPDWMPEITAQRNRLGEIHRWLAADLKRQDMDSNYARGLNAYVDGDYPTAVLLLNAVLGGPEKGNEALDDFTRRLARERNVSLALDDRRPLAELVNVKLIRSEEAVVEEDYNKALQLTQEAATLDNNNATAYVRLGTLYFLMGLKDKALDSWERSLEIDPGNEKVRAQVRKMRSDAAK